MWGRWAQALLNGNTRKALVSLTNTPLGAPRHHGVNAWLMAVTELRGRLQTRKGEWHCGICPASTTAEEPRGLNEEGGWEGREDGDVRWMWPTVTRKRERESVSSPGPEWVLWCWLMVKHLQAKHRCCFLLWCSPGRGESVRCRSGRNCWWSASDFTFLCRFSF